MYRNLSVTGLNVLQEYMRTCKSPENSVQIFIFITSVVFYACHDKFNTASFGGKYISK